jgi:hypothetical protein
VRVFCAAYYSIIAIGLTLVRDAPLFAFDPLPFSLNIASALAARLLAATRKSDE